MTWTYGQTVESLVTEKTLMLESAGTLDDLCEEIGVAFEDGYAVTAVTSMWYNIYVGARNYATPDIDFYAYKLANDTCDRHLKKLYAHIDKYVRQGVPNEQTPTQEQTR